MLREGRQADRECPCRRHGQSKAQRERQERQEEARESAALQEQPHRQARPSDPRSASGENICSTCRVLLVLLPLIPPNCEFREHLGAFAALLTTTQEEFEALEGFQLSQRLPSWCLMCAIKRRRTARRLCARASCGCNGKAGVPISGLWSATRMLFSE